jgi:hypothetical protein
MVGGMAAGLAARMATGLAESQGASRSRPDIFGIQQQRFPRSKQWT